jgi:hypothetical protein
MKKLVFLFFVTLFASSSVYSIHAYAADCKLAKPIAISGDLLNFGLTLKNVKVDSTPQFTRPEKYDSSKDTLSLNLFNIEWNSSKVGYIGAYIGVVGKSEGVGFAHMYSGNFSFQGGSQDINGERTYYTKTVSRYDEPQHAKNDAIHEVWVKVQNNQITSIALSFPVFKVWKTEKYADYVAFTGKHQALCVVGAQ